MTMPTIPKITASALRMVPENAILLFAASFLRERLGYPVTAPV